MSSARIAKPSLSSATTQPRVIGKNDGLIGSVLGGTYRIERLIAEGGMGAVYEAEQLRLHRRVAVKVLMDCGQRRPEFTARFCLESEIVTHLEHPHIVQVLDVGRTSEGLPYLVMEYLQGRTLRERLRRDKVVPVAEALRLVMQLCSAVAQVHARGFVHCDIKPSNVFLIQVDGLPDLVKLLDFGVSIPRGSSQFAGPGQVAGTPCFMAPEQAQGQADLDHRADQFAVAAIAYEMLSGRRAFCDDLGGNLYEPLPLSVVAPWVPLAFDGVLARALSRDRERRYPGISLFALALEAAADHSMSEAAASSSTSPSPYPRERLPERSLVPSERPSAPPTRVEGPPRNGQAAPPGSSHSPG